MTTITRVRTDWVNRYHVQADTDASVLDCFVVDLPPYSSGSVIRIHDTSQSIDERFQAALRELARLRATPYPALYPQTVFIPFGVITARNSADLYREREIAMAEILVSDPDQEERVRALCKMLDALNGDPLPQAAPFPLISMPH